MTSTGGLLYVDFKEDPSGDPQPSLAARKKIPQMTRWTTWGGQLRDKPTTKDREPFVVCK